MTMSRNNLKKNEENFERDKSTYQYLEELI